MTIILRLFQKRFDRILIILGRSLAWLELFQLVRRPGNSAGFVIGTRLLRGRYRKLSEGNGIGALDRKPKASLDLYSDLAAPNIRPLGKDDHLQKYPRERNSGSVQVGAHEIGVYSKHQ